MWQRRAPLISFVGNVSYRRNSRLDSKAYADFKYQRGSRYDCVTKVQIEPSPGHSIEAMESASRSYSPMT